MDKNALDDIHNTIHWMMKNSELFEGDTLNQVRPEQKKAGAPVVLEQLRRAEAGRGAQLR
jgi:hypothetical protein